LRLSGLLREILSRFFFRHNLRLPFLIIDALRRTAEMARTCRNHKAMSQSHHPRTNPQGPARWGAATPITNRPMAAQHADGGQRAIPAAMSRPFSSSSAISQEPEKKVGMTYEM